MRAEPVVPVGADVLPPKDKRVELPIVPGDATVLECAATMARLHMPLLVVADSDTMVGVVTASHLLEVVLAEAEGPA